MRKPPFIMYFTFSFCIVCLFINIGLAVEFVILGTWDGYLQSLFIAGLSAASSIMTLLFIVEDLWQPEKITVSGTLDLKSPRREK